MLSSLVYLRERPTEDDITQESVKLRDSLCGEFPYDHIHDCFLYPLCCVYGSSVGDTRSLIDVIYVGLWFLFIYYFPQPGGRCCLMWPQEAWRHLEGRHPELNCKRFFVQYRVFVYNVTCYCLYLSVTTYACPWSIKLRYIMPACVYLCVFVCFLPQWNIRAGVLCCWPPDEEPKAAGGGKKAQAGGGEHGGE